MPAREPFALAVGDMVTTPSGRIGLLMGFSPTGRTAVQFANNGPWHYFTPARLRRATRDEIEASPLAGVGCNQADEWPGSGRAA